MSATGGWITPLSKCHGTNGALKISISAIITLTMFRNLHAKNVGLLDMASGWRRRAASAFGSVSNTLLGDLTLVMKDLTLSLQSCASQWQTKIDHWGNHHECTHLAQKINKQTVSTAPLLCINDFVPPTGCASSFSGSAVEAPGLSGLMSLTRSSAISHRMLKSEQLLRGRLPGGVSSWQTFFSLCWKISLFLTHEMNVKAVPHTLSWNACHSARSLEQPCIHTYVLTYLYYILKDF